MAAQHGSLSWRGLGSYIDIKGLFLTEEENRKDFVLMCPNISLESHKFAVSLFDKVLFVFRLCVSICILDVNLKYTGKMENCITLGEKPT